MFQLLCWLFTSFTRQTDVLVGSACKICCCWFSSSASFQRGSNYFLTPHFNVQRTWVDMHSMQIFARARVRVRLRLCMRHCFLFIHGDRRKFSPLYYLCHCFISSCKCTQTCPHIYDYARQWNSIELNCSIQRRKRRIAHRNKANAIVFSYLHFLSFPYSRALLCSFVRSLSGRLFFWSRFCKFKISFSLWQK